MVAHVHPSRLTTGEIDRRVDQRGERFRIGRLAQRTVRGFDHLSGGRAAAALRAQRGERKGCHERGGDALAGCIPDDHGQGVSRDLDVVPVTADEVRLTLQRNESRSRSVRDRSLQQVALDRRRDRQLALLQRELLQLLEADLHLAEAARDLSDLVPGADIDLVIELPPAHGPCRVDQLRKVRHQVTRQDDGHGDPNGERADRQRDEGDDRGVGAELEIALARDHGPVLRLAQQLTEGLDLGDQRAPVLPEHPEGCRAATLRMERNHVVVDEDLEALSGFDEIGQQFPLLARLEERLGAALVHVRRGDLAFVLGEQRRIPFDQEPVDGCGLCGVRANDLVHGNEARDGTIEDASLDRCERAQQREGDPPEECDQDDQEREAADDLPPQGKLHRKSILDDVRQSRASRPGPTVPNEVGHRITRVGLGAGALVGLGAYAFYEPFRFHLVHHDVPVRAEGPVRTILHVSDTHLNASDDRLYRFLVSLPERLGETPDLVLATGDLIEGNSGIRRVVDALARLEARLGRFYVLGSHDYYMSSGPSYSKYFRRHKKPSVALRTATDELTSGLHEKGWVPLTNRTEFLDTPEGRIRLAGVDDPHLRRHRTGHIGRSAEDALAIALVHAPDVVSEWALNGFDLILAGHTHGGQVRVPGVGAVVTNCSLPAGLAAGLNRVGNSWLHVSPGLGNGLYSPIRFNCPPEATFLRLVPGGGRTS
jgi:predicted MPP superfamily phosphohydrolase